MASHFVDEYLGTFFNWEARLQHAAPASFSLDRVERLLCVFGRPDERLRFAHVAGTKGKGSTCAFLASILQAAGYRVGLYTSPHLYSVRERIRILEPEKAPVLPRREVLEGAPTLFQDSIPDDDLERLLRHYQDAIEALRQAGVQITFYELITVLAVAYFAQRDVDIVVLETGLGGRLDATNVFETSVCGLTPVGFDHTQLLGMTIEEIAGEKAGIIKAPFQRVVLAPQPPRALPVFEGRCRDMGICPSIIGEDILCQIDGVSKDAVTFDVQGRRLYEGLSAPLTGAHQAQNAALAIAMAEDLEMFGFVLTEEAVRAGVGKVTWPARFERIAVDPVTVIDCAHTVESARVLLATMGSAYPGRRAVFVVGMSIDKDVRGFVSALASRAQAIILTRADHPRSADLSPVEIGRVVPEIEVFASRHVGEAMDEARRLAGREGVVVVTGSVFVCAQARVYVSV